MIRDLVLENGITNIVADMKNTTTRAPGTFPTRIRNRNRAMVQLYEWLVITPFEIKEAYILGDFFPRKF